jgi:hypothetical protein
VHVLLQDAILRLEHRYRGRLRRSMTSREVLCSLAAEHQLRATLATLVVAVEHSVFGAMELGQEDFERCQEAWEQVVTGRTAGKAP